MKRILAALAVLPLAAAPATPTSAKPYAHNEAAVVRVFCTTPAGYTVGTAVKIGAVTYITAAHVVDAGECSVDGQPISVTLRDTVRDYATFTGPASSVSLPVSCRGFVSGGVYLARGYANGGFADVAIPWQATVIRDGWFVSMLGEAIPGMSGGPVLDRWGRVVGIINMRWPARSLPLTRTTLCR